MATPPEQTTTQVPVAAPLTAAMKPIHSLVLDTGPLIKNDPSVSVLIAKAEKLYILPSVIPEIRDEATRTRVETTLLPFVTVRSPNAASLKFVREFARKTGDLPVLSRPDLEVLALGYELECERNNGDWRLRNTPGQKGVNGKPPQPQTQPEVSTEETVSESQVETPAPENLTGQSDLVEAVDPESDAATATAEDIPGELDGLSLEVNDSAAIVSAPNEIEEIPVTEQAAENETEEGSDEDDENGDASDDDGGWITPSNLKKHKAQDTNTSTPSHVPQKTLQAAVLTSDFAMQNVALRMNLNLITPAFARITQLKTWILRCHGCFKTTKDMEKRFCPNCGQPTLTRTSCSTDQHGNFRVHLKKNFQWNNRGNVYSVPKPVHGSSNGRLAKYAGGQGNWGAGLILAEDQKEHTRATEAQRKAKKKDLMDDDYLPDILSGHRAGHDKIRVGAGRTINSKRRN